MSNPILPKQPLVAITGCRRGLGRALVEAYAGAGCRVLAHARTEADARALAEVIEGDVHPHWGDVRDASLSEQFASSAERYGGVDLLILNAGVINTMGPLLEADIEEFESVMAINVNAQLRLLQRLVPAMKEKRAGAVLWLTSGLGRFGLPHYGAYCASKHAVEGLMKVLAEEAGESGVVSAAIAPGMVQTDMLKTALGTDDVREHQTPESTAKAFLAFTAELSAEHNGQSLDIAGWL